MRLAVGEGHPDVDDRVARGDAALHLRAHALLHRGDELPGHGAADDLVDELEARCPPGSGSTSMSQTAYWPWPPDCLTCRPWPVAVAGERLAQRHPQLDLVDRRRRSRLLEPVEDDVGVRLAHAPQHDLVGLGVVLDAQRRVLGGEPLQALATSLSSSALARASIATGSSGSGIVHGSQHQRRRPCRRGCRRSRRGCSRPIAQMSPATAQSAGRWVLPERDRQRADPLVLVVVLVARRASPKNDEKWPETCTVASGRSVPEKTRTRLTRPTYGSVVVLTTSATSGPSGSQVSAGPRLARPG